jgi:hypothetical protein
VNAPQELAVLDAGPSTASASIMMNPAHMHALLTFAETMAKSAITVPAHLVGKPADCMAIAMQAAQWGMNPFAVAQKTHVVSGRLGYEAQLVNAVVQSSGAIRGSFHYEFKGAGDSLECRVGAVLRGEAEVTWGEWLRNGDVTTRNSPLWKVNPKQQLGYLQVKNWARLHTPGAILGIYTPDELEIIAPPAVRNMGPADEVKPELQPYPMADFERNFPAWQKAAAAGKKTAADMLATLQTKATLTDAQKAAVLALKPAQAAPEPKPDPAANATDTWVDDFNASKGVTQ